MLAITEEELFQAERWLCSWPSPFADRGAAEQFFGGSDESRSAWARRLIDRGDGLWPRFDIETIMAGLRGLGGQDRWAEWDQIEVPILLCLAENTLVSDNSVSGMSGSRPGVTVTSFLGAGHDVHLDAPAGVASETKAFIDRW